MLGRELPLCEAGAQDLRDQTQGGGGAPCQKAVYGQYIGYLEQSDSHTHMQDSRSYIAREREREKGPQHTVASGAPSGAVSSRRLHARACIRGGGILVVVGEAAILQKAMVYGHRKAPCARLYTASRRLI